jgi:hypothetical protein
MSLDYDTWLLKECTDNYESDNDEREINHGDPYDCDYIDDDYNNYIGRR